MDRIRAFISYSVKQKIIGGRFSYYLTNYCGYETFVAHDDIPASSVWEDEIIKAITNSDFFIPLLSEDFKFSDFTDQETGIAVSLGKKIIPIKLAQVNPYGFISKYQAMQYKNSKSSYTNTDNIKELVLAVTQIGLSYKQYHQKTINSLIYAFCKSNSFDAANAIMKTLTNYEHFTQRQLQEIMQAININDQISGAFGLGEFKKFLQRTYNVSID